MKIKSSILALLLVLGSPAVFADNGHQVDEHKIKAVHAGFAVAVGSSEDSDKSNPYVAMPVLGFETEALAKENGLIYMPSVSVKGGAGSGQDSNDQGAPGGMFDVNLDLNFGLDSKSISSICRLMPVAGVGMKGNYTGVDSDAPVSRFVQNASAEARVGAGVICSTFGRTFVAFPYASFGGYIEESAFAGAGFKMKAIKTDDQIVDLDISSKRGVDLNGRNVENLRDEKALKFSIKKKFGKKIYGNLDFKVDESSYRKVVDLDDSTYHQRTGLMIGAGATVILQ